MYYKNKKLAKRKKEMVLKDIHLGLGYQSFIPHKLPMVASEKLVLKHSSFPPTTHGYDPFLICERERLRAAAVCATKRC